jgi:predicted DNA-binding antitoxin AbrB/MazE fold protein
MKPGEQTMSTVHAVFENGVFRPTGPVELPEHCEVEFEPRVVEESDMAEIYEVLSHRHDTGIPDLAARHNEHQP